MPATPARVAPVSAAPNGCGPWCTRDGAGDGAVVVGVAAALPRGQLQTQKPPRFPSAASVVASRLRRGVPRRAVLEV